jgi:hypothetical protein
MYLALTISSLSNLTVREVALPVVTSPGIENECLVCKCLYLYVFVNVCVRDNV